MKSGFISIIGRPNVGKSTILNAIMRKKISIVTNKAQTTRNNIKAIYNTDGAQLVFLDTPGIHKPFKKLGIEMNSMAYSASHDADVLLYVIDASLPFGKGDEYVIEHIGFSGKLIICFNKIDQTRITEIEKLKAKYKEVYPEAEIIETVATENVNIDALINKIIELLPEGPQYYPEDFVTDTTDEFRYSEIIREKVLKLLSEEVPHSIAVVINDVKKYEKLEIYANIIVEKESQKGIVIGKGGTMIKKIGSMARQDIENTFKKHCYLELRVKVKEDWRDDTSYLNKFGYNYKNK